MLRLWWSELLVVSAPTLQYTAMSEYHVSIFYWRSRKSMKANTEFNLCQHTGCCIVVEVTTLETQAIIHARTDLHSHFDIYISMHASAHPH